MSIIAGFMVPHPPLIIPEIGKGEEKKIQRTIDAYETVADQIEKLKPEVIIISSPHTVMYADYFHISPGRNVKGSFSRFNASKVCFEEEYDTELRDLICEYAKEDDFPAGILGQRDSELDHGCLVPLFFIRRKYKEGKIIRIGLSGVDRGGHDRVGGDVEKAVEKSNRKAVDSASGGLAHKLQEYGPYGFTREGVEYDARIMDISSRAAFDEYFDFSETFLDKAAECGHRSFVMMAGAFDRTSVEARQLSHEDITGVGYGICTFYPKGEDDERNFLEKYEARKMEEHKRKNEGSDSYVKLARSAIEHYVIDHRKMRIPEDIDKEMTQRKAGAFVSIHKKGRLRGCIGTIMAVRENLAAEIIENAISACSRDPRFDPVKADELKDLEINVDVLGEIEDIDSKDQLDVKRYGVIVSCGNRRGLLLPDLDGVDSIDEQINIAREKGGIRADEDYKLSRFEVIRHY